MQLVVLFTLSKVLHIPFWNGERTISQKHRHKERRRQQAKLLRLEKVNINLSVLIISCLCRAPEAFFLYKILHFGQQDIYLDKIFTATRSRD